MVKCYHLLELLQLLILANSWYLGWLTDVEIFFASNKQQFLLIVMFRDVNYCKPFKIVQVYYLQRTDKKSIALVLHCSRKEKVRGKTLSEKWYVIAGTCHKAYTAVWD